MDTMMQIYKMLERELEELSRKELTSSSLGSIEKITHSMKSLAAIMGMSGSSGGYSGNYPAHNYSGNYSNNQYSNYSNNYSNEMSGNSQRYSNRGNDEYSNNYSNGYSGNSLREHLEHAMRDATDDRMRDEIRRLMNRV